MGFTSSTLERDTAIEFAFEGEEDAADEEEILQVDQEKKMPVLMEIEFTGTQQYFCFNPMDSQRPSFSAFPEEKEVLLQDGIEYTVLTVGTQMEQVPFTDSELTKELTVVRLANIQDRYGGLNCCARMFKLLVN